MARRNRAFLLLAFALAAGALAAVVALRFLRQQATPLVSTQQQKTSMIVAARALPVGAIVSEQDVKTLEWSGGPLPAGYASSPTQVIGRGLLAPVEPNEPIMSSKLAAEGAGGGLPVIIEPGMRALSIAVDQVVGVSGFVLPNTRVDVLLTLQGPDPATKIIMQDVRTLAAGQTIQQDKEGKPMPVPVITLLLSPEQAETLAFASAQGRIQLALRHATDTTKVVTRGARQLGSIMGASAPRAATGGARRVTTPRPAAAPDASATVEVYRGGVRTLQRF